MHQTVFKSTNQTKNTFSFFYYFLCFYDKCYSAFFRSFLKVNFSAVKSLPITIHSLYNDQRGNVQNNIRTVSIRSFKLDERVPLINFAADKFSLVYNNFRVYLHVKKRERKSGRTIRLGLANRRGKNRYNIFYSAIIRNNNLVFKLFVTKINKIKKPIRRT